MDCYKLPCPCRKKDCERHGNCEACRHHHETERHGAPTACERKATRAARKEARKSRRASRSE